MLYGSRDRSGGLVQQVQFFSGFEANCLAWGDGDLGTGPRIAADSCLPWFDGKDSETTKFDAVTGDERLLHTLEDSIHRSLCFCAWKAGAFDYTLYKILLYHFGPPSFGL